MRGGGSGGAKGGTGRLLPLLSPKKIGVSSLPSEAKLGFPGQSGSGIWGSGASSQPDSGNNRGRIGDFVERLQDDERNGLLLSETVFLQCVTKTVGQRYGEVVARGFRCSLSSASSSSPEHQAIHRHRVHGNGA